MVAVHLRSHPGFSGDGSSSRSRSFRFSLESLQLVADRFEELFDRF